MVSYRVLYQIFQSIDSFVAYSNALPGKEKVDW